MSTSCYISTLLILYIHISEKLSLMSIAPSYIVTFLKICQMSCYFLNTGFSHGLILTFKLKFCINHSSSLREIGYTKLVEKKRKITRLRLSRVTEIPENRRSVCSIRFRFYFSRFQLSSDLCNRIRFL